MNTWLRQPKQHMAPITDDTLHPCFYNLYSNNRRRGFKLRRLVSFQNKEKLGRRTKRIRKRRRNTAQRLRQWRKNNQKTQQNKEQRKKKKQLFLKESEKTNKQTVEGSDATGAAQAAGGGEGGVRERDENAAALDKMPGCWIITAPPAAREPSSNRSVDAPKHLVMFVSIHLDSLCFCSSFLSFLGQSAC